MPKTNMLQSSPLERLLKGRIDCLAGPPNTVYGGSWGRPLALGDGRGASHHASTEETVNRSTCPAKERKAL